MRSSTVITLFITLGLSVSVSGRPGIKTIRQNAVQSQNGQDADAQNRGFANLQPGSTCENGSQACIGDKFAQCVNGKLNDGVDCAPGTVCRALPLVNAPGTSVTCTTEDQFVARMQAAGVANPFNPNGGGGNNNNNNNGGNNDDAGNGNGGNNDSGNNNNNSGNNDAENNDNNNGDNNDAGNGNGNGNDNASNNNNGGNGVNNGSNGGNTGADADPQTSLTLDESVIATGFASDGQDPPVDGQAASLTSTNNFINFCVGKTITNGKQIREGSCNPAPIGDIPSVDNMPSSKFLFPPNGDTSLQADEAFTIQLRVARWDLGTFVNPQTNYFAAPQQLNNAGQIIGHTHVAVEELTSLDQTKPTNPNIFAFFKGINTPARNGIVTAEVADGLPRGFYRVCSMNAAMNHQPIIVAIAQHGAIDDCAYFTVN